MRAKLFMALMTFCLVFAASCDSSTTPKYLEFATDMLLPQATIDKSYDFTFIVTYGGDRWDENTGFVDSDIIWGFDSWKLNSLDQTEGPVNLIFADGKITGTPTAAESGLWSFNATIQKGKKTVIETFFLPI
ncbi:MAG: hypothetical protein K8S87_01875, partial [Planctomycetes bacterium]|nr:hypothetical protein [Planctomycetota bacterium]